MNLNFKVKKFNSIQEIPIQNNTLGNASLVRHYLTSYQQMLMFAECNTYKGLSDVILRMITLLGVILVLPTCHSRVHLILSQTGLSSTNSKIIDVVSWKLSQICLMQSEKVATSKKTSLPKIINAWIYTPLHSCRMDWKVRGAGIG